MVVSTAVGVAGTAAAFQPPTLSAAQHATLKSNFALCLAKLKGPYTENFCLCRDGEKRGVQAPNVTSPEILADGRVTFRVGAPNAQTVLLGGEFITQANAVAVPAGDKSAGPKPDVTFDQTAAKRHAPHRFS